MFIFDQNLNKRYFDFGLSRATGIDQFNSLLYVSTYDGKIYVIQNETVLTSFTTSCSSSVSITIDYIGNKAILCPVNFFLFNVEVYDSQNILDFSSPMEFYGLTNLQFDASGNFIVVADYGLFILGRNKTTNQTNQQINFNRTESCPNSMSP